MTRWKYRDIWIDLAILTLIVLTYTLTGAATAQQVNRDATLPVYSSATERGVAVEVAVCGDTDVTELAKTAGEYPLSVFLCGDVLRKNPGAAAELASAGVYGGAYDCGRHECDYDGNYPVLMGKNSRYTGDAGLRWSVDANVCSDLDAALFNGCIVKVEYTDIAELKKVLNIIGRSGYNMIHLDEMI